MGLFDGLFAKLDKWDKQMAKKLRVDKKKRRIKECRRIDAMMAKFKQQQKPSSHFASVEAGAIYWFDAVKHLPYEEGEREFLAYMNSARFPRYGIATHRSKEYYESLRAGYLIGLKTAILLSLDYLFTFTYDGEKYTERKFRRGIVGQLKKLARKEKWHYVGFWMRGKTNNRLYLQAVVSGKMVGELEEVRDFQKRGGWKKTTLQSTYFNGLFGRTTVELLDVKDKTYSHRIGRFLEALQAEKAKAIFYKKEDYALLKSIKEDEIEELTTAGETTND